MCMPRSANTTWWSIVFAIGTSRPSPYTSLADIEVMKPSTFGLGTLNT